MDRFLEKYNIPKLNEEDAKSLNRPITADEIETVIKKRPKHKGRGQDGFTGEFYKAFKGELTPILHRLSVSYTHLTLPTNNPWCRSRWSPYH